MEFVIDVKYGVVDLTTWFELVDGKFVGMSRATHYDRDGKMISTKVTPTGIVMYLPKEARKKPSLISRFVDLFK